MLIHNLIMPMIWNDNVLGKNKKQIKHVNLNVYLSMFVVFLLTEQRNIQMQISVYIVFQQLTPTGKEQAIMEKPNPTFPNQS